MFVQGLLCQIYPCTSRKPYIMDALNPIQPCMRGLGQRFYLVSFCFLLRRHRATRSMRGFLLAVSILAVVLPARLRAQAPSTTAAPAGQADIIIGIRCHGNHRVPCSTIKTRIFTKPGDIYSLPQINRDFMSLWNTGFFDSIKIGRTNTPHGVFLDIYVVERPLIRSIKYKGLKSVTESDVLDAYKARNVHLDMDSQFDPTVATHAEDAIRELLSEHGRQYATIKLQTKPMPPSSVALTFVINEGPKVKVGHITFSGNKHLGHETLVRSMKNMRPIGVPYSIFLENLFSKTYSQTGLSEDLERIREAYQDRGYFEAVVEDPTLKLRTTHSIHLLFWGGHTGKSVDIHIPIVEGHRYRVGQIRFVNNHFITNDALLMRVFQMQPGQILNVSKLRKGLKNLRKLYGQFGYINFVAQPYPSPDEAKHVVNITFHVHEGKPYYIRRIEFTGNTTTRDKVIRRELLVEEGQRFNSIAWQNSLLRLNQLGYFNKITPQDATITQDNTGPVGHVDINLHVSEKGKNTIGLTGGVSGITGSFLGLNYQTNNFLGLGETLSISTQWGSLEQAINFGFTQPYFLDRPIQLGFSVYDTNYHFDQAKEASIFYGYNVTPYLNAFGQNLLNYAQSSKGFNISSGYPMKNFMRIGLSYGYDDSTLTAFSNEAKLLFNTSYYQQFSGPNSLTGIRTSSITPSITYNTVNGVYNPTAGHEIDFATQISGLGGNVKIIRPNITWRYFRPSPWGHDTLGFRFMGAFITGYGYRSSPPTFDRFYIGGEDSIRGFDLLSITPFAYEPTIMPTCLHNPSNPSQCFTETVPEPTPTNPNNTQTITFNVQLPQYQLVTPGGDTEGVFNFEYRHPIFGPVTLAYFVDAGVNRISFPNQLRINNTSLNTLETTFQRRFNNRLLLAPGTNNLVRVSTGLELQVLLPMFQVPLRLYFAWNPSRLDTNLTPPALFNESDFLKSIPPAFQTDAAVLNAIRFTEHYMATQPGFHYQEAPHVFRFTIGRTF